MNSFNSPASARPTWTGLKPAAGSRRARPRAPSPRPTGGEESHGLGLAIVKLLAESQHGAVGADFPATGGSVFWFRLPVLAGS